MKYCVRQYLSLRDIKDIEETVEQNIMRLIFNNLDNALLDYLYEKSPLCQYSWITAQQLVSLASSPPYNKSYFCLLKYFGNRNISEDDRHCTTCKCMTIDLNKYNNYGFTPFLKSLPCELSLLKYQVEIGADIHLIPRCSLLAMISPLFVYMKHLVDQVYNQKIDSVDVDLCIRYLCSLGLDPNYVPCTVSSNLLVLFSIAADISVQSDFESKEVKFSFLDYLDRILEHLLLKGLDPTIRCNSNKLSYELHGDGLFDFIFMLKYPSDEVSIDHVRRWLLMLIKHGCDPEVELRSKCRDLLRFKLVAEKPNNALSVFYFVLHKLFHDDFVLSPNIGRINAVLRSLTSQRMLNMTVNFFRKTWPDSPFSHLLLQQRPPDLRTLSRHILVSQVLNHRPVDVWVCDLPAEMARFVEQLE